MCWPTPATPLHIIASCESLNAASASRKFKVAKWPIIVTPFRWRSGSIQPVPRTSSTMQLGQVTCDFAPIFCAHNKHPLYPFNVFVLWLIVIWPCNPPYAVQTAGLVFAQLLGFLPVCNVMHPDTMRVKFAWRSFRVIWCLFITAVNFGLLLLAFRQVYRIGLSLSSMSKQELNN